MAHRLPTRFRPAQSSSCLWSAPTVRGFTTTSSKALATASEVPPESPRYITVPKSAQATSNPKPRIRGIMPVPRNILDRVNEAGDRKFGKEHFWSYIKHVVPKPRKEKQSASEIRLAANPQARRIEWKARLSAQRRQNLLQGIQELKLRRHKRRRIETQRSEGRKARREALKAEREARQDDVLTSSTTTAAMQPQTKGRIPDPDREVRVAEMKARAEAIEARKAADRQDALHTLYMHARDFITTEEQLDAAIEKTFGSVEDPKTWGYQGVSIWDSKPPESIYDKLQKANRARNNMDDQQGFAELTNKRIKRIAEELTGGKMQ